MYLFYMDNSNPAPTETPVQQPPPTNNVSKPNPSRINFVIFGVAILASIVIGLIGGYFIFGGIKNEPPDSQLVDSKTNPSPTIQSINDVCPGYGVSSIPEDFLETYKITVGETPREIITKLFGDDKRVDEFMRLNQLTMLASDSFIAERVVVLPPKEVTSTTGAIFGATGQLKRIVDKTYWLKTRTINSEEGDYPVNTNSRTKIIDSPKIGECLTAVIENGATQVLFLKKSSQ